MKLSPSPLVTALNLRYGPIQSKISPNTSVIRIFCMICVYQRFEYPIRETVFHDMIVIFRVFGSQCQYGIESVGFFT